MRVSRAPRSVLKYLQPPNPTLYTTKPDAASLHAPTTLKQSAGGHAHASPRAHTAHAAEGSREPLPFAAAKTAPQVLLRPPAQGKAAAYALGTRKSSSSSSSSSGCGKVARRGRRCCRCCRCILAPPRLTFLCAAIVIPKTVSSARQLPDVRISSCSEMQCRYCRTRGCFRPTRTACAIARAAIVNIALTSELRILTRLCKC